MSSTLCMRRTIETPDWSFKQPVKGIIARRYYDHDGSLGGGYVRLGVNDLSWFEGMRAGFSGDAEDALHLDQIIQALRDGGEIDMWLEV